MYCTTLRSTLDNIHIINSAFIQELNTTKISKFRNWNCILELGNYVLVENFNWSQIILQKTNDTTTPNYMTSHMAYLRMSLDLTCWIKVAA